MFLDRNGTWVRRDKLAPGNAANGVDGDPRQASAEMGRLFIDFKVEAAVARIRKLTLPGG
jgi:creatinine amidohydrolase/Fe(II)-dependent formamide hydrolase-like protein